VRSEVEDELKVSFPEDAELPPLADEKAGLRAEARAPVVLRSVYHDTADGRLLAAGVTVRRRTRAGGSSTWDVKVPVKPGDTSVRREVSFTDRAATPPARVADLLVAWTGGEALVPVATLRTRRLTWTVVGESGEPVAIVVDDDVEHLDGRAVLARFREVEVERHGVDEAYVRRLARRLAKAGGEPSTPTKLARVLGAEPRKPAKVRRDGPAVTLLAASLRRATADLLAADVGARLGEDDAIHQLRVACRRMRSDLRAFGGWVDADWRDSLVEELRWAAGALGTARDAEVVAERIANAAADLGDEAAPLLADVAARRVAAEAAVAETLRDPRYVALVARLRTADLPPVEGPPARDAAAEVVTSAWRDLERSVRRLRGSRTHPDAAWHAVRINAKRARYAAETASVVLGRDASRLAKAAERVQDVLGTFHDATCAAALLNELAAGRDGTFGVVAGRLVERELRAAEAAKAGLRPVWRDVAVPELKRWRRR